MTMIVQLFVLACACALGVTEKVPPYLESLKDVINLNKILKKNVLALDGDIPLLNDHRRHYTAIVHVLYDEAILQAGCAKFDYDFIYQRQLNESASEGIAQPQKVIDEIKELIRAVKNNTGLVVKVIQSCASDPEGCDEMVHGEVKADPDILGKQADVLLAAGEAASAIKSKTDEFLEVSKKYTAIAYVLTGATHLKDLVLSLGKLLHILTYCS